MSEDDKITKTLTRGEWMDVEAFLNSYEGHLASVDLANVKAAKGMRKARFTSIRGKVRAIAKKLKP